jgi:hypothetical protein
MSKDILFPSPSEPISGDAQINQVHDVSAELMTTPNVITASNIGRPGKMSIKPVGDGR